MTRKRGGLILLAGIVGCGSQVDPKAVEVNYASYEDCLLDKIGGKQNVLATEVIIAACRSKFPGRSLSQELDPDDKGDLVTRHLDGEAGGAAPGDLWDEFDSSAKPAVAKPETLHIYPSAASAATGMKQP